MNVNTYGISLWMEWSEDEEREMEREWIATWLPYIQFNTSAHFHSPSSLSFYFLILFFLDRNSRYDFFSSLLLSFACIDGIALRQRNDEACILAFVMYRDSLIELIEEYDIDFVPHAPCTALHKHILFHSPTFREFYLFTHSPHWMCANLSMADCGCCLAGYRSSFSRTTNKRRR